MTESLKPWAWNPNGGGAAGFSDALLNLFATECQRCEHHNDVRAKCKHVADFYNGHYPKSPPPAVWFTNGLGLPVCTDLQQKKDAPGPDVGKDATAAPTPPPPPQAHRLQVLVFDTEKNKLFCIETADTEKYQRNNYIVNPLKNKVLEYLLGTIYK